MTIITGDKIALVRLAALEKMLKLEIRGLKRRGRSAYSLIKEEFGYKGNRASVRQQLRDELILRGYPLTPE